IAASKSDEIAFVVSAGAHGLIGVETAIHTRNAMARSAGETKEETIKWTKISRKILLEFRDKNLDPTAELKQLMIEKYQKLSEQVKSSFPTFESYISTTLEGILLTIGKTSMYRSFLAFDPQETYKQVKCPILLMFAGKDLFHPPEKHKDAIITAITEAKNEKVVIHDFPNANHNFTKIENQLTTGFVAGFCDLIVDWIREI
ncbi:MAG: hypothetical protein FK732_09185, partial [Asgard group archaeon]|nr:hypothetical protein [Asgard group archaeon]